MTKQAEALYHEAGKQFAPAIARLARAVERDAEKARDLEQEMHCAIWTSLARFKGESALKTWVYRVAHNVAADHISKAARGPKKVPLEEIDMLPSASNPETKAAEAHALDQIAELIRRLPPLDAQVIVLWLEGESGAEIADITGMSSGAVSVRIHRIKALLASHFTIPENVGAPE
ncbi:RNA polymerase sigma factor [Erythrobacter crassostreae]|uniref:Sigma-70 family RNA polymerase sigma factor n=1 Tax=Erythrobacter crassostreae TaxID=2828328 RepID=A0A9X1F5Q7_9SPHN|nr:sigma-70 family RNA polymerase sigma factor [Erythrobacter crassostrea]MBV7259978.1 sigma-70 family RNA polymerase sigma factor [Erythrobacter crassostrea]